MSNGFNESDFLTIQKMLIAQGAMLKIVSMDSGLVNGWDGKGWGHNFAVDAQLNTALGIDFDALVIPGGTRSLDKLKLTAHSRRFIGSFLATMKPVIAMGDAVLLLAHTDHLSGKTVSGPVATKGVVEAAGAKFSDEAITNDQSLMTGLTDDGHLESYVMAAIDVMTAALADVKQAA